MARVLESAVGFSIPDPEACRTLDESDGDSEPLFALVDQNRREDHAQRFITSSNSPIIETNHNTHRKIIPT